MEIIKCRGWWIRMMWWGFDWSYDIDFEELNRLKDYESGKSD